MIFQLDDTLAFPDPRLGESSGLFAVGGDLNPDRLELAYQYGIFPWSPFRRKELHWYCPMRRYVIFADKIHESHSMRTLRNSKRYQIILDKDFESVIRACSTINNRHKNRFAWLGEDIIQAFLTLHQRGVAHSVEAWNTHTGALAGGFYGVLTGNCFVGESMFAREPNTSKLALIALCRAFAQSGQQHIIDCQIRSDHFHSLGGQYISYTDYLTYIHEELPEIFRTPAQQG